MKIGELNQRQVAVLNRMLTGLPKKIRNKILREELRKAAKTLIAPSKAATPVRTGKLRKSVKVRSVKNAKGTKAANKSIQFAVGYSDKNFQGDTFYGSFLEFGWRVGKRQSKAKKAIDTRKKIPGRRMLGKVAEAKGPALLASTGSRILLRIQQEAKNG
jgi:HK97 gp10 family phage protein